MSRKQGKRNQRKQEKKRRTERVKRAAPQTPTAYTGNKYRTEELVETHLYTETGIFQADLISQRKLTDAIVESALQQLILQLRHGRLTPLEELKQFQYEVGQEEMLILHSIRFHWHQLSLDAALPGRDSLVGVLRSILGSVETWTTARTASRGYLEYLEDFLGKLRINENSLLFKRLDESMWEELELEEEVDEEDIEESLLSQTEQAFLTELERAGDLLLIGRAWYRLEDSQFETLFRTIAEQKIDAGEAAEVAEICRQLIQESPRRSINADLTALALEADRSMQAQ